MRHSHTREPDLNLLVALEALLTESNVTRAAKRLGLTQSAMSHKLRRLREVFEDPLLVGGRAGMVPTPRGQALLGPLRRGLGDLRSVLEGATLFDPATSDRRFTVASTDYAEFGILPLVLEHATEHAPGVQVIMREPWPGLGQALEDGTVDLHVGMPLPERSGLVQRKIAEDDFKVLCRKGHPLIGRSKTISLDLFLSARHLAVVPGRFETGGLVDEVLATLGRTRRVVMQIPHFLGGPFIVARSDLLMTASSAWAREACLRLPLQMFEVPLKMPRLCIFMTWHERFSLDPAHQWLRDQSEAATVTIMEKPGSSRARAASDKGRRVRD